MIVKLVLHTVLQSQLPVGTSGRIDVTLSPGATLGDLINTLGLIVDDEHTLLVINSRWADRHTVLSEGDEVHLIPAISGG